MNNSQKKLGLFGFGCVGQGLHDVLENSKGFRSEINKIVVKDKEKKRPLPARYFGFDKDWILEDDNIDLVVELIDNADDAYEIVTRALGSGKNVVSANKKMIAEHYEELVKLQHETGSSLLYEASSCGSIPIIRNLEEYYDNEMLNAVSGIFNGSSNYILSKVINEGLDYDTALTQAQAKGFAESDPTLDVEGYDAKYKLIIIAGHAYGVFVKPENVFNYGISNLKPQDIEYAQDRGLKIKLVASVKRLDEKNVTLFVTPQFVEEGDHLYNIENEYNGVVVEAAFSDKQLFLGKGAGGHPTGSAVLSDISANAYDYKYEYKKYHQEQQFIYNQNVGVEIYLRFPENGDVPVHFESIEEKGDNYVIGTVKLAELIEKKDDLNKAGAFLASTGKEEVLYTTFKKKKETQQVVLV